MGNNNIQLLFTIELLQIIIIHSLQTKAKAKAKAKTKAEILVLRNSQSGREQLTVLVQVRVWKVIRMRLLNHRQQLCKGFSINCIYIYSRDDDDIVAFVITINIIAFIITITINIV